MQQDHEDWRDFLMSDTYEVLIGHGRSGRCPLVIRDGLVKLEVGPGYVAASTGIITVMRKLKEQDLGAEVRRALAMSEAKAKAIIADLEKLGDWVVQRKGPALKTLWGLPVYIHDDCGDTVYITTDPPWHDIAFIHEMGVRRLALIKGE